MNVNTVRLVLVGIITSPIVMCERLTVVKFFECIHALILLSFATILYCSSDIASTTVLLSRLILVTVYYNFPPAIHSMLFTATAKR